MHCEFVGVHCLCSFPDRLRPADADALRNPQQQLANDCYRQVKKTRNIDR